MIEVATLDVSHLALVPYIAPLTRSSDPSGGTWKVVQLNQDSFALIYSTLNLIDKDAAGSDAISYARWC